MQGLGSCDLSLCASSLPLVHRSSTIYYNKFILPVQTTMATERGLNYNREIHNG
jgi:hypothetical protein